LIVPSAPAEPTPVPPTGAVFFPLASNAQSLLSGSAIKTVRSRLKLASLLFDHVLLEAGEMIIQAGPTGASAFRVPVGTKRRTAWQSTRVRGLAQSQPFTLSMAPESSPGVTSGPFHQMVHSQTSICWQPTLEPFAAEFSEDCDWIQFGHPGALPEPFERLKTQWERRDDGNETLNSLIPERFVRSTLIKHVSADLAIGAAAGWDISVDRFHGRVLGARFSKDDMLRPHSFALPVLVPHVTNLPWEEVARIRRLKAIERLREVLREVETEAFEGAKTASDLEPALRAAYENKIRKVSGEVEKLSSVGPYMLTELLVGAAAGYSTTALAMAGPVVGAAAGASIMGGLHIRKMVRNRRERAWLGVMDHIVNAASQT
jgi:hypothetical protein